MAEEGATTPAPSGDPELTGDITQLLDGLDVDTINRVAEDEPATTEEGTEEEAEPEGDAADEEDGETEEEDDDEDDDDETAEDEDEDDDEPGEEEDEEGKAQGKKGKKKEAPKKSWTLKANGKTHKVDSEEDLLSLARQGISATERFQAASKKLKDAKVTSEKAQGVLNRMSEDPLGAFLEIAANHFNGDFNRARQLLDTHVNKYLEPRLEQAGKSQEALDIYNRQEELKYQQRQIDQQRADEQSRQAGLRAEHQYKQLQRQVGAALEKAGLKPTRAVTVRVIAKLREQVELELTPDPEEAAREVAEESRAFNEDAGTLGDEPTSDNEKDKKKAKIKRVKAAKKKKRTPSKDGKPPRRRRSKQAAGSEESLGDFFGNLYTNLNE